MLDGVLGFLCCYNKIAQTEWLRTTEIYSLKVLEIENEKKKKRKENEYQGVGGTGWLSQLSI